MEFGLEQQLEVSLVTNELVPLWDAHLGQR